MNKFKVILICTLVLFYNLVNAQDNTSKYLVTYIEKRITTETELKRINTFPQLLKERMLKQINVGEEKFLFMDNMSSVFSLKDKIKTKDKSALDDPFDKSPERTTHISTTDYYKRGSDSLLIISRNIKDEIYIIKTRLHPLKWKLVDEIKEIKSMTCKKAIVIDEEGNTLEAWYTEEISIPNGPSIYGGLPGLIVELKTKNKVFFVTDIEETNSEQKIKFPSLENSITMEDYKKKFSQNKNESKKSRG